jgi:hypothetical protein
LVGAVLIDPEGIYDPRVINDRLVLGLHAREWTQSTWFGNRVLGKPC